MIRFNALTETADKFARWHVKQQGESGSNIEAFWRHWAIFVERQGEKWSEAELACIYGYAAAACRYGAGQKPHGGLWAQRQG